VKSQQIPTTHKNQQTQKSIVHSNSKGIDSNKKIEKLLGLLLIFFVFYSLGEEDVGKREFTDGEVDKDRRGVVE